MPTWTAAIDILVDDPRSRDIAVPLQSGARISGRVVFQGRGAPPAGDALLKVPMAVRPADGGNFGFVPQPGVGIPQSRIEPDGTFRTIGLPPGEYVIGVQPGGSTEAPWNTWQMSSILVNGREVLGRSVAVDGSDIAGVVVTMTDQPAEIRGTVRGANGAPSLEARVIVFPRDIEDRRHYGVMSPRRIMQVVLDGVGAFRSRVIPGDYLVTAVTSLPRDWMAPEYLQTIAGSATAVRVTPGAIATVSVTARPSRR